MHRLGLLTAIACVALLQGGARAEERFKTREGEVVIRPLGHASVRIDFEDMVMYVDPWSRADLDEAPPADVILVTDADAGAHHLDPAAIQRLRKASTTIIIPASGRTKLPDAVVMANGEQRTFTTWRIEVIGSYDLRPGQPFHQKGVANGYLVTVGGLRVLFAGVTECVPEISGLKNIDVVFIPMNLPNGRMTVEATAACLAALKPAVAYPYHYDQGYIGRLAGRSDAVDAGTAERSVRELALALAGKVDVRSANWYPVK